MDLPVSLRARILALVPHAYVEGPRGPGLVVAVGALLTHPEVRAAAPFVRETALLSRQTTGSRARS
jgi:ABC-type lipoprotein release transport system permease subunit